MLVIFHIGKVFCACSLASCPLFSGLQSKAISSNSPSPKTVLRYTGLQSIRSHIVDLKSWLPCRGSNYYTKFLYWIRFVILMWYLWGYPVVSSANLMSWILSYFILLNSHRDFKLELGTISYIFTLTFYFFVVLNYLVTSFILFYDFSPFVSLELVSFLYPGWSHLQNMLKKLLLCHLTHSEVIIFINCAFILD